MSTLAVDLAQTAPMWARAVAPFAEWVARTLWSTASKPTRYERPATRLTQHHRREAKGAHRFHLRNACHITRLFVLIVEGRSGLGEAIVVNVQFEGATQRFAAAAEIGRSVSHSAEARAKQTISRRRHAQACSAWDPSTKPAWLTDDVFLQKVYPLLSTISASKIATAIGVSRWYAGRIREGYRPHPRGIGRRWLRSLM